MTVNHEQFFKMRNRIAELIETAGMRVVSTEDGSIYFWSVDGNEWLLILNVRVEDNDIEDEEEDF